MPQNHAYESAVLSFPYYTALKAITKVNGPAPDQQANKCYDTSKERGQTMPYAFAATLALSVVVFAFVWRRRPKRQPRQPISQPSPVIRFLTQPPPITQGDVLRYVRNRLTTLPSDSPPACNPPACRSKPES